MTLHSDRLVLNNFGRCISFLFCTMFYKENVGIIRNFLKGYVDNYDLSFVNVIRVCSLITRVVLDVDD